MPLHINDFSGKHLHMIGIGGSSMSGLAGLLKVRGYQIAGSDNYASYLVREVESQGIPVKIGHSAENVHGADLVVYSAAISPDNPERLEADRLHIPQMERSVLLGQLMEGYRQAVAVAGTHGKTTTTAMLTQMLTEAGEDPSAHIGGHFEFIGGSTRIGAKNTFVAEACEFHKSFLEMRPSVAVILNIDLDHLDFYRDIEHITETFGKFIALVPPEGWMVGNGDDERVRQLSDTAGCKRVLFGLSGHNNCRPFHLTYDDYGCASFDAAIDGHVIAHVDLHVGGAFNVLNALGAIVACYVLGVDMAKALKGLSDFTGVHRRFEHTGTVSGVKLYHDYGHNPAEMRGALSVAVKQPHNRLWAVMQPHTYSRVKRLFAEYIHCCEEADEILITEIYAARESDPGDINSRMLVDEIRKTGQNVHLTPSFDDTEAFLRAHWQPGDLVLTMGCGNINELNDQIKRNSQGV